MVWYIGSNLHDQSYFMNLGEVERLSPERLRGSVVVIDHKYEVQKATIVFDCSKRTLQYQTVSTFDPSGKLVASRPSSDTASKTPEQPFDTTELDLACGTPDSVGVSYAKKLPDGISIAQYAKYMVSRDYDMNDCGEIKTALEVGGAPKPYTDTFLQRCTPQYLDQLRAVRGQLGMK